MAIARERQGDAEVSPSSSFVTEIIEHMRDGACLLARDWRILSANRCAAAMLGVAPDTLTDHCLWEVCPWLAGTDAEASLRLAMETRRAVTVILPAHGDDRPRPAHAVPSEHGLVLTLSAQSAETPEDDARECAVLAHIPAAIFEIDLHNRRFVTANEATCRLTGYTRSELLATDPLDLLDDESRAIFWQRVGQWMSGEEPTSSVEYRVRTKNGRLLYALMDVTCTHDEERRPLSATVVAQDITARRKMEITLRAQEERFRLLAEMAGIAILVVQDGVLRYVNPYLLQRWDCQAADLLGQPFLGLFAPEYHAAIDEVYHALLQGQPAPASIEIEGISASGMPVGWLELRVTALDYNGRPAMLAIAVDITERKRAEQVLLEAGRAKDEFLAVLSHELLTPLTAMLGWSAEAMQVGTPEFMAVALPVIHRNAERQKRRLDDLLNISRLIHDSLALTLETADLVALARQAVDECRRQADARQLRMAFTASSDRLPIVADAARVQQCVSNLLSNSLKFTPPGGTITVHCRREGDRAVCVVEDNGRGIAPRQLVTIFDPFTQVDRDERAGGLGLGLAITHRLIELHGGDIRAESDGLGHGSRFIISLPLVATNAEEA